MKVLKSLVFLAIFSAAALADGKLSFLTYNLGLLTDKTPVIGQGDLVPHVRERAQKEVIPAKLGDSISKQQISVVALQEVWEKADADLIAAELKKDYSAIYIPENNKSGLMLLVRNEVLKVITTPTNSFTDFKEVAIFERGFGKGFQTVEVESLIDSKFRFQIFNTHHVVPFVDKEGKSTVPQIEAIHFKQSTQIGNALKEKSNTWDQLVVLLGDINAGPNFMVPNYEAYLKDFELRNALLTLHPWEKQQEKMNTWLQKNYLVKYGKFPKDPNALIDHLLYRDGKQYSLKPTKGEIVLKEEHTYKVAKHPETKKPGEATSPLSDHYGVYIEAEWAKKK